MNSLNKPIIRKVDSVGRVSIPPKLLDKLHIQEGSSVLVYMEDEREIILKKDKEVCVFCGSPDVVVHTSEIEICAECRKNPDNVSDIVNKRYEKQMIPNGRRLVIPFKIRHQLKIDTGDKIQLSQIDNTIHMEKLQEDTE